MSQNEIIAKRLSELRKSKGVKQDDIAELLNVRRSTVANYETGNRTPDYETLIKLADYYGVSCDYIIRGIKSEFAEIHSTTGLSDNAIEVLRFWHTFGEDYSVIPTINALIESEKRTVYEELGYYFYDDKSSSLQLKLNITNQINIEDFQKKEITLEEHECLQIVSSIEHYLNLRDNDRKIIISQSGKIRRENEPFDCSEEEIEIDDFSQIRVMRESELVDKAISEKIIEKLKTLRKEREQNADDSET